jgi:hypothetical protein
MKIPLPNHMLLSLDAPTVAAYARNKNGHRRLWVWCRYCKAWHSHGQGEGHREAHCSGATPYTRTGYNLALAGKWRASMNDGPPNADA